MNFFVEGLQGSGKSTLVGKLSKMQPILKTLHEGDYSPVELAWCAYLSPDEYQTVLDKYSDIREQIEAKSHIENNRVIICYTQVITDVPGFHKDMEQYEIYNGRLSLYDFKKIVLTRYKNWNEDNMLFECSLFQNTVEDMILYRDASDDEIIRLYREIKEALGDKEYKILYLKTEDISSSVDIIRKERSDDQGNELWFPLMLGFFNESLFAKNRGLSGEDAMMEHFSHRQELELRICREVFPGKYTILDSKKYDMTDIITD